VTNVPAPVAPVTARRLLAQLAGIQVEGRLPSIVAGVVRDGALVWSAGYGDVPGDPVDVQYKIGSITKTMTAVLVLQLVDEGQLRLDEPVSSVLGDIGYGDRTIRSLLAHNAGLQAEPRGPWWERSEGGSFDDLTAANDGSGGVFPVGRQFHYSNLAYALLGEVVAQLRNETWWESVESRILGPLGMRRTSYHAQGVHAQGYSVHPYANTLTAEPHPDTGAMAPAGQLWSTVTDLATYAAFLLEGGRGVLSRERLDEAMTPQSGAPESGLAYAHGLGFQLVPGGSGTLVGHSGSMPGFVAACFVDRSRRTGVVAFSNAMTGMGASTTAATLLEELERSEPTVPSPWRPVATVRPELADLLGVWHWGNTAHVFELEGEDLVVRLRGTLQYRFRVLRGRIVGVEGYQSGEELRVVRDADSSINHLDLGTFIFTRQPYDPKAPIPGGAPT
jgi:CubicO group peptidase (beta-lactamase class C family)